MLCLSYYLLSYYRIFSSRNLEKRAEQVLLGRRLLGAREAGGKRREEGAQTMCTRVSKCKNDKINEKIKQRK
jgi:hypothetical protein